MDNANLSPLAIASRDLVLQLSKGTNPEDVAAGCRELLTHNTNGLGSVDTRVVDVASEIVRGVLTGVVFLRSPMIAAATRGVCETGIEGEAGDAERLRISERTCTDIRDSDNASISDFRAALKGAAPAAHMSEDELEQHIAKTPTTTKFPRSG